MNKKYDYLIIGAGLYGATFAQQMTQMGKKCLIIEKRDHIAGNIYTKESHNIQIHQYGAHIFHTDNEEVWNYLDLLYSMAISILLLQDMKAKFTIYLSI